VAAAGERRGDEKGKNPATSGPAATGDRGQRYAGNGTDAGIAQPGKAQDC
jgi:hypothetical protein